MLTRTLLTTYALGLMLAGLGGAPGRAQAQTGPVIEDVEPTSGPPGTVVRVSGRHFPKDASVSIAGRALPVVERLPNRISVQVVEGSPSGNVAVSGQTGAVRGPEFRVTPVPPAPTITAVEPTKGAPGTRVVLRGKNFSPRLAANMVTLSGRPVVLRAASSESLELTVPQGASSGPFVVRVAQAEVGSAPFEVLGSLVIDAVSPARAVPHGELTIRGQGFSAVAERNRVFLGNVALQVKSASERELVVVLPAKIASAPLLVDVEGGGRVTTVVPVLVQLPPQVASFAPRAGSAGTLVTVRGTSFGGDASAIEAKLVDQALSVRSATDTALELEIPAGAKSGSFSIRVHGVGPAWSEQAFVVQSVLSVKSIAPESGTVASELVIDGDGFAPAVTGNRVRIGGKVAQVLQASATRLRVRVPDGDGGEVEVQVQGAGTVAAPRPFATQRAK